MNSQVGRIQWSKLGITIYDGDGSFICRLEHIEDRNFFAGTIMQALKVISAEQARRKQFKSQPEASHAIQIEKADAGSVRRIPGQGDAGQGARVGSRDAESEQIAAEGTEAKADTEKERQVEGVPI